MMTFQRFRPAHILRTITGLTAVLALGACDVSAINGNYREAPVTVGPTAQNLALRALPAPTHRIEVAVYDFPDLTGQYKERDDIQSLSRAVTQGGATMLIKALQDSGDRRWFTVLDRAGLQDLLRERQIVTEMRRQYRGETNVNPNALGPLRHAGILLQGGIIGYDTNVQTGGFGARYLGIGAFTQWSIDTITVNLRAVATESGEVLASVTTQKSILSTSLNGSVFRYVAVDELLEGETGVTANEPKLVATQQAIEKAVAGLVIEGLQLGIWDLADPSRKTALIQRYRAEEFRGNRVPNSTLNLPRPRTASPATITQTSPRRPAVRRTSTLGKAVVRERRTPVRDATPPPPAPPPAADGGPLG